MKICMENLGAIRYAEVDMSKLTIICGLNNSGKTYVTYAIYGFLHFWRNEYEIEIEKDVIKRLREEGLVSISLTEYIHNLKNIIQHACDKFAKILPEIFAAQEKLFEKSSFKIEINEEDIKIDENEFKNGLSTSNDKTRMLVIQKEKSSSVLNVALLSEKSENEIPDEARTITGRTIPFQKLLK